jgi:hypothetical protein
VCYTSHRELRWPRPAPVDAGEQLPSLEGDERFTARTLGGIDMTDEVPSFPIPAPDKVAASFRQLEAAASQLNAVSDELGKSIAALDATLARLNLGVSTWVTVVDEQDGTTGAFWEHRLGYTRVGSKWGLALRHRYGFVYEEEQARCEEWLFNDAPRIYRIEAIDALPKLVDALVREADLTVVKLKDRIAKAQQLVKAFSAATPVTLGTIARDGANAPTVKSAIARAADAAVQRQRNK